MASFVILTDHKVLLLVFTLLCLVVLRRIQRVSQVWKAPGNLPAYFIFVSPTSIFGRRLPRIPWISPGVSFNWRNAYERQPFLRVVCLASSDPLLGIFAASKSDIVQIRSLFPFCTQQLLLADATAVKVGFVALRGG